MKTNWIKFISNLMMLDSSVRQRKSKFILQRDENNVGLEIKKTMMIVYTGMNKRG